MTITLTAPAEHAESVRCWCHPEAVIVGYVDRIAVARLVYNDMLGAHFGLYASTRLWDRAWEALQ